MATTTVSNMSIAMSRPRITPSQKFSNLGPAIVGSRVKVGSCAKLGSVCHVASAKPFQLSSTSHTLKFDRIVTKAMAESSSNKQAAGLPIDLRGFTSFSVNPSYHSVYYAFVFILVMCVCVLLCDLKNFFPLSLFPYSSEVMLEGSIFFVATSLLTVYSLQNLLKVGLPIKIWIRSVIMLIA